MKLTIKFIHILFTAFLCTAGQVQAGTEITLKDGKTINLPQTHFAIRPMQCLDDVCASRPILKPRNICIVAICKP